MKRKAKAPPPWFRLRCAASVGLAAGVWFGVFAAARDEELKAIVSGTAAQASPAGATQVPPVKTRPPVVIDPGHGGKDPGKVAGDQFEKTWTLQLCLELAEELRRRGIPVEMTRDSDATLSLDERSALANRNPRATLVSIHFNSGQPEANGIEVYYAWPRNPAVMVRLDAAQPDKPAGSILLDDRGRLLAEALQTAACEATGARNRGVRNDPEKAVLNRTLGPGVLIECGFLTNPAECANIRSEAWRRKLATGLAASLDTWLQTSDAPGYGIHFEPAAAATAPPLEGEPTALTTPP